MTRLDLPLLTLLYAPLHSVQDKHLAIQNLINTFFGHKVSLSHLPSGAPLLNNGWNISISHCRTLVAVTLWQENIKVGVDVETMRTQQLQRVAPRYLSVYERELFRSPQALLQAWTAKEAVYKALLCPQLTWTDISLSYDQSLATVGTSVLELTSFSPHPECILTLAILNE